MPADNHKQILDACCGSKMFWHNKERADTIYMDIREVSMTLCDGRALVIIPDIVGDFRQMPFKDNTFSVVVFDPPHLIKAGAKSWLALKYGVLGADWRDDLYKGFSECFRVLKPGGLLLFKWSEIQIPLKDILSLVKAEPLILEKKSKRHWVIFMKEVEADVR